MIVRLSIGRQRCPVPVMQQLFCNQAKWLETLQYTKNHYELFIFLIILQRILELFNFSSNWQR